MTGDIANPFYSDLASGIERELRKHGLQLITASSDEDPARERELIDALIERRVAALFIAPTAEDHSYLRSELADGVPIVFLDRPRRDRRGHGRPRQPGRGRRRRAPPRRPGAPQDRPGRRPAEDLDLPRATGGVRERSAGRGHRGARTVRARRPARRRDRTRGRRGAARARRAAHGDPHGEQQDHPGALRALHPAARGARRDVALVGFDDFELADILEVSVVGYEVSAMGQEAARLAVDRIEAPGRPARLRVVPTVLVPRGSGEIALATPLEGVPATG
ncbi:substrate-binding domain-containing protein [Oerskovia sp. M15]